MYRKGFTLIELLIVVAIIAILAAIAVPNFLEAQVRAKVTRTKSEMRTLATAIEAYQVDHNKPPPQSKTGGIGPFNPITLPPSPPGTGTLTHAITTPIAYMTTFMFFDPFSSAGTNVDERLYSYHPYTWIWPEPINPPTARPDTQTVNGVGALDGVRFKELYGHWRLLSIGPDRTYYNQPAQASTALIRIPYDPTNGSVSGGNVIRSQKQTEQNTF